MGNQPTLGQYQRFNETDKDNWSKSHIVKQYGAYWYPMYFRNGQHVPYKGGAIKFTTPQKARDFLEIQRLKAAERRV